MDIKVFASGSSGNCYWVSNGCTTLLLEAGIPLREIRKAADFRLYEAAGCLLSHEHLDHAKAAKDVAEKAGIDVYASHGTLRALGLEGHKFHALLTGHTRPLETLLVYPFEVCHDAAEPLGYAIESKCTDERLLYLTDTFYCKYRIQGMTHCMIECNYSEAALQKAVEEGRTPPDMAKRLRTSHMSLETLVEFFRANDCSKLQQVYLLHLSNRNSDEQEMKQAIQRVTGAEVYIA